MADNDDEYEQLHFGRKGKKKGGQGGGSKLDESQQENVEEADIGKEGTGDDKEKAFELIESEEVVASSDNSDSGGEDQDDSIIVYRCELCRKDFKSEPQLQNHLVTKVHRKKEAEMMASGKGSKPSVATAVSVAGSSAEEDQEASEGRPVQGKSKKALKKQNKKNAKVTIPAAAAVDEDKDLSDESDKNGIEKVKTSGSSKSKSDDKARSSVTSSSSSSDSDDSEDEQLISVFAASKIKR